MGEKGLQVEFIVSFNAAEYFAGRRASRRGWKRGFDLGKWNGELGDFLNQF